MTKQNPEDMQDEIETLVIENENLSEQLFLKKSTIAGLKKELEDKDNIIKEFNNITLAHEKTYEADKKKKMIDEFENKPITYNYSRMDFIKLKQQIKRLG